MQFSRDAKLMVVLLAIAVIFGILSLILQAAGIQLYPTLTGLVVLLALIALLALHARWQLGTIRAVSFFLLAAMLGFLFEVWGLKGGTFFGGRYVYNGRETKFLGVPYFIPMYWAVFIYTAYSISNSFLAWSGHEKPSSGNAKQTSVIALVLLDGILTVALDLVMDPVQVREGSWTWLTHGAYFGIPVGNFVGWFIVTVLVTGAIRFYEYCKPSRPAPNTYLLLLPVVGYTLLGLGLAASAVMYRMYWIAAIGIFLFLLIAITNATLFLRQPHRTSHRTPQLKQRRM